VGGLDTLRQGQRSKGSVKTLPTAGKPYVNECCKWFVELLAVLAPIELKGDVRHLAAA
jgi:hypothetical protein